MGFAVVIFLLVSFLSSIDLYNLSRPLSHPLDEVRQKKVYNCNCCLIINMTLFSQYCSCCYILRGYDVDEGYSYCLIERGKQLNKYIICNFISTFPGIFEGDSNQNPLPPNYPIG